ncbi:hypothetical protein O6H91_08G096900 [Diphasiastrum complanatum]|uniref:Uncharacterized protein n=1 Tax=Diphasiastrum complanatum TaxID=34168 RepID=A0ACC2D0D6_DIPCM|nr:hypothetical protein O6H91_08G096900 [Diphasiastrum complanatum]
MLQGSLLRSWTCCAQGLNRRLVLRLLSSSHSWLDALLPVKRSRSWCNSHHNACKSGYFSTSADQESLRLRQGISIVQKIQSAVEMEECLSIKGSAVEMFRGLQVLPYHVNEVLKSLTNDKLALKVFQWAKSLPGFKHDNYNYTVMIGILGKSGDIITAKQFFEEMLSECCHADIFAFNNLLKSYASVNRHDEVLALFRKIKTYGCRADRCTFTIVIDSLGKLGRLSEAKVMYRAMQKAGWQPDIYVFNSLIHNFGRWGNVSTAMKCFQIMKKRGLLPSSITYSTLIDMHAKAGNFNDALDLYKEYRTSKMEQDLVVYNSIMHALGKSDRVVEAEWVFSDIQKAGLSPDVYTYCILVSSWGREGNALEAQDRFEKMVKNGVRPNVPVCNALIHAYHKAQMFASVGEVLSSMREKWGLVPTLQTYTYLLSFYTDCNEEHADRIRSLMLKTCHPAHAVVDSILCWKRNGKELQDFAKSAFQKMQAQAHSWTRGFANALVNCLHRRGYMLEAYHVWEAALGSRLYPRGILEQNGNCWNILLLDMEGGTALVALTKTLVLCKKKLGKSYLETPARVVINTGWGKYRSSRISEAIGDMLHYLKSPFQAQFDTGRFMCDGKDFKDWLDQPFLETELALKEQV